MKKDVLVSKKVKAVIASAMAVALAAPSMALLNRVDVRADEELPAPIAVYDFDDLAKEGAELVDNEVKPDVKDDADRSGKVLELKEALKAESGVSGEAASYTNSELKVQNPYKGHEELLEDPEFAGYEPANNPLWEKGVTISYWQKASSTDSATISFSNVRENIIHKDDADKLELFELYEREPENDLFKLGEVKDLEYSQGMKLDNGSGRKVAVNSSLPPGTYTVYENCGLFIRFNPNYNGDANACYLKPVYITYRGEQMIGSYELGKIGEAFNKDEFADLGAEGSQIRYVPKTAGGLQLNSSGSWAFYECGAVPMMKGNASYGKESPQRANYAVASSFIKTGDVTKYQPEALINKPAEWHYITRVIKNDCIITYVDGVEKDRKIYTNIDEVEKVLVNKSFNVGWGYYGSASDDDPMIIPSGVDNIFKTILGIGRGNSTEPIEGRPGFNGNTNGMTILEMLVDEGTTLSFGGHALCVEEAAGYYVPTTAGTALDNVAFYDVPFTSEQAAALYEVAKTKNIEPAPSEEPTPSEPTQSEPAASEPADSAGPEASETTSAGPAASAEPSGSAEPTASAPSDEIMLGDVDGNQKIELKDAQLALKKALNLIELDAKQIKAADVDKKDGVSLKDAQMILKKALNLISDFN